MSRIYKMKQDLQDFQDCQDEEDKSHDVINVSSSC